MANPISSVILYNCKINHNGLFGCDFGNSGASRDSVMGATNSIATVKFSYSNCTYFRKDKTITVDENADVLDAAGVNYCRYINPQFNNTMYFYAFVDKIEYVAPSTSRLHIRTDCFMTYFHKIEWGEQYVERFNTRGEMSVVEEEGGKYNTDVLNGNAYISPVCYHSEAIPQSANLQPYDGTNDNGWVVINFSKPDPSEDYEPGYGDASPICAGLPTGTFWYAVEPTDLWRFLYIISGPQAGGSGSKFTIDDILSMYYIPRDAIEIDTDNPRYVIPAGGGADCNFFAFEPAVGWQGGAITTHLIKQLGQMNNSYEPCCKMLLRYPYNYYKITDRGGHEWIFKPELFIDYEASGDFAIKFRRYLSVGSNLAFGIRIVNYQDGLKSDDYCIFQNYPEIPAVTNTYQQYLALNKNTLQTQRYWMNSDLATGITNTAIGLGKSAINKDAVSATKAVEGLGDSLISYKRETDFFEAKLADKQNYPNSVSVPGSGNLALQMGSAGLFLEDWSISPEAAEKIDRTYDALGYPVNQIYDSKPYAHKHLYAYVKTKGCHLYGEIPESDRAELDKLFDAGMTIWHYNGDFGTYDMENNLDT